MNIQIFGNINIGDTFVINNTLCEIRDYTIIKLHANRNDYRTKRVDTVVWSLFDNAGNEYRKTTEDLTAIKKGA